MAFPQLTSFGQRFKLGGYPLGGSLTFEVPTFTRTQANQAAPPDHLSWRNWGSCKLV
jgi:hypothetical protein